MKQWPKEISSRYGEYKFVLDKVMSDRAKYKVIDVETGKEEIGGRVYGTPSQLQSSADDLIKPQGGTQSTNLGEELKPLANQPGKYDGAFDLMNTLMSSGKVNKPTGGASMNGKYYHLQGGTKYDVIHFDYDSNSEKPFGVVQVAGHHLPTNLLNSLGFRETRSWTAGVEVYIADGNLNPKYISEEEMAQLVDEWGKGVESYAKAMGDFYKDRGKTSGTIDEVKAKIASTVKEVVDNRKKKEFKVGDKVTYLGHPGEITKVNKEMTGATTYNVAYNKGTGRTKVTNVYNKGGEIEALEKEKKSKFKKHGEMSGFDMRGINEQMDIYDKFLEDPQAPKGRAKAIISKFIKKYGEDASQMAVDRFAKQNNLKPEEKYILKYITKNDISITSQPGGPDFSAVNEAKATCCHRCGRVHVKGTPCKKPYLKGKKSCAIKEVQDLQEMYRKVKETKSAPEGHYFTKSGNLVKGRMTKDAEERGARKSDPKDKMRSNIPKVTQYTEAVEEYIKSNPRMKKSKMMEAVKNILKTNK